MELKDLTKHIAAAKAPAKRLGLPEKPIPEEPFPDGEFKFQGLVSPL